MESSYIEVPGAKAKWRNEIDTFALSFNAYDRIGDFGVVSALSDKVRERWNRDGTLPDDLDSCRTSLFFEQRRFRQMESQPKGDDDDFVRAILGQIRYLSGGRVPGPADALL